MIGALEDVKRSLRLIIGKCLLSAVKQGAKGHESEIILLGSERHGGVRLMQHYGFASLPVADSEAIAVFVGGSRDNGVIVAEQGDAGEIPHLESGEVALFSKFGQKIVLKNDGSVSVNAASGKNIVFENKVVVNADFETQGNITSGGNIASDGDMEAGGDVKGSDFKSGVLSFNMHVHVSAAPGSPTSGPQSPPSP